MLGIGLMVSRHGCESRNLDEFWVRQLIAFKAMALEGAQILELDDLWQPFTVTKAPSDNDTSLKTDEGNGKIMGWPTNGSVY
jgi:hypothetical protein